MEALYVNEWIERYEVNAKLGDYKPGQKLAAKLKFIKVAVKGDSEGEGWKKLKFLCGSDKLLEVFGLFIKCLELAGCRKRECRGWLLDGDMEPATAEYMSLIWDVPKDQINYGLDVLIKKKWLVKKDFPGSSGKIPESSESSVPTKTKTKTEQRLNPIDLREVPGSSGKVPAAVTGSQVWLLVISEILGVNGKTAEHTTFKNLALHLSNMADNLDTVYDDTIKIARMITATPSVKNPKAVFISRMQKDYGFYSKKGN